MKSEDKYEVIIPEKRYIIEGLKNVKIVIDNNKVDNVCIKLIKLIK